MKKGWEVKKLGEVCDFQNGFAFQSKTFKEKGVPVVRITNIQNEVVDISNIVYVDPSDYDKNFSKYEIVQGDLLIAMSGATTGKIGIHQSEEILLLNQRVGRFEPKERLLKIYLFYYLLTKVEESLAISTGSAQPNLSTQQIKNFPIPMPPLDEQRRIVAILDRAFAAIDAAAANIRQNLHNANELFQSQLNRIFSQKGEEWIEKKLGEVCSILNGGTPKTNIPEYWMGDILWITPKDMGKLKCKYVDNTSRKITKLGLQKSSAKLIPANSIILSTRAPIGHLAINKRTMTTNQGCRGIVPDKNINTNYLYYFLSNNVPLLNDLGKGTTFKELSSKALDSVKIPIFPLQRQNRIVEEIESIERNIHSIKSKYQHKFENLIEFKQSLLQQAFAGELTDKEVTP